MKKFFSIVFVVCALLQIASLGYATDTGSIRITDDSGYTLEFKKPVSRVIGLYTPLSECMLALGVGNTLVGRTFVDAHVKELAHLPPVGTPIRTIPSRITALKPDVVLQYMGSAEALSLGLGLRKAGFPVLLFRLQNFEDIFSTILRLGKLAGVEKKAETLVKGYKNRLGHLRNILLDVPRVSVAYELRYPNLILAGSHNIIMDILDVAGARNVIVTSEPFLRINEKDLQLKDPEAYIIQQGLMNPVPMPLKERPSFDTLQAVKNKRILQVNEADFAYPGPQVVDAAERLAYWLHPKVNFNIETPEKIDPLQRK